ncbi:hypothetical protein ACIRPQ_08025 [Streptomyces sp. NPDC101213]|uniref:hypothetical protein n=1 Tax=Streptomyces sp. NPDC101213 TaxID=3366130 RepID=UPI00380C0861
MEQLHPRLCLGAARGYDPGPNQRSGFVDGQGETCQRRPRTEHGPGECAGAVAGTVVRDDAFDPDDASGTRCDELKTCSDVNLQRQQEEEPAEEPDEGVDAVLKTDAPAAESLPAEQPAAAHGTGTEAFFGLSDRRIPVFTLGVGLALVGLGIGFLGVRMRRP